MLRNFLSLLLDPDSPLAIRKAALPTLFPWMARFAYESLPHRYRDNARRIAELVSGASSAWTELAAEIEELQRSLPTEEDEEALAALSTLLQTKKVSVPSVSSTTAKQGMRIAPRPATAPPGVIAA